MNINLLIILIPIKAVKYLINPLNKSYDPIKIIFPFTLIDLNIPYLLILLNTFVIFIIVTIAIIYNNNKD